MDLRATDSTSRQRLPDLHDHLARHLWVQQQLDHTRARLDRELERFAAIQRYYTRAIAMLHEEDFAELTAETVVEVFELELGALWTGLEEGHLASPPDAAAGAVTRLPDRELIDRAWARLRRRPHGVEVIEAGDALLEGTGLAQFALAACPGPDGHTLGLLVAGRSTGSHLPRAPLSGEQGEALHLLAQQVGALLRSRRDQRLIRQQLETIRLSEERLSQAVNGSGMGLWEWDLSSNEVLFSDTWYEMLGYTAHPRPLGVGDGQDLIHPDDLPSVVEKVHANLEGRTDRYTHEHRMRRKDGRWAWILAKGKVLRDDAGQPTRMIGVHVDISERRAAEEAVRLAAEAQAKARQEADRANRSKSVFLASMSHEIRTPMTGVLGMLQLLQDSPLDQDQRKLCQDALGAAQGLLTIIDDILDLSKIEAGKLTLEKTAYSPARLLRESTALLRAHAVDKGLDLRVDLHPSVPHLVVGDPGRVRQVLTNLVGNAIKFTGEGAIHVRARYSDSPGTLQVEVQDTGIGIAPDVLSRLFRPFVQADAATTRRYGGTGLGLAISRRLVEHMGGSIEAESTLGAGSLFRFKIAAPLAAGARQAPPCPPLAAPDLDLDLELGPPRQVLVVEDNPVNQRVVQRMLQKLGLEVVVAAQGACALDLLLQQPFDLVLMDMHMPVMDGLETTRRLRTLEERLGRPRVPVLALTASVMAENQAACLEAGMDDFLAKPIQWEHLAGRLQHWLGPTAPRQRSADPGLSASPRNSPSTAHRSGR